LGVLKVLACITTQHDWRLVVLAALICVTSVLTTFSLYARLSDRDGDSRSAWLCVTGLVAGSGVWATHFIAMLAFEPGFRTGYEPATTLLSWLIAVVISASGFTAAGSARLPARSWMGGGVLGAGVGLMHYVGMAAFRTQGVLLWNPAYVTASIMIATAFAITAVSVANNERIPLRTLVASGLFTLAICGLHFTGMTAVQVLPDPTVAVPASIMSHAAMAVSVAVIVVTVIAAVLSTLALEAHSRRQAFGHLRDAIDAMSDGVAIYDQADCLVTWNARYAELVAQDGITLGVGLDHETFLRRLVASNAAVIEAGTEEAWIQRRLTARRSTDPLLEQQFTDGRWLRIEHRHTRHGGMVTTCVDVTDLKRNAQILALARDEAEAANRAKSEFLATMSHEIRTPMNGVMGMNALLLRSPLTHRQRTFAEAIASSADALMVIINDILDVSKLEAGKITLDHTAFSLESVIEQVVEHLSPKAAEKGLEIGATLDFGARGRFRGDSPRLRQILLNLMSNAIKFTAAGSARIEVRSRPGKAGHTRLRIEVLDTGIGVDSAAKAKLFQKFQQADGSITRRFGGAGLGLSISRELVELMGGRIDVEDRPDGGAVFWFEVELAVETPATAPSITVGA
jgi:signal transduction histidine kinase